MRRLLICQTFKQLETARADFPTSVARHLRAARSGIVCCCVLRAAYGLATAHAQVCIVIWDD